MITVLIRMTNTKRLDAMRQQPPDAARQIQRTIARVSSAQLLAGNTELIIEHDGREYRLRITQNGKLILTA